jgi:hypothetical protein
VAILQVFHQFSYSRKSVSALGDWDAAWIERRFVDACAALGTKATVWDGRLVARWR